MRKKAVCISNGNINMPLIFILGLPGTGKSYLALALVKYLQTTPIYLNTDIIRRKLFNFSQHRYESFGADIYSEENRQLVYNMLHFICELLLQKNHLVIVEGTFNQNIQRKPFYNLCEELNQKITIIRTVCSDKIVKKRIEERKKEINELSDADYSIYLEFKKRFEPLDREHLIIDTERDLKFNLEEVRKYSERI